jgi:hypothetical protein
MVSEAVFIGELPVEQQSRFGSGFFELACRENLTSVGVCAMRMAFSECARDRRLHLFGVGAKSTVAALVAVLLCPSIAQADTCLASAEEVRKITPNAWPKWTYGPNRERCWYSGQKPVFARTPRAQAPEPRAPVPEATTDTASEPDDSSAEPVKQPWALEYRWSYSLTK